MQSYIIGRRVHDVSKDGNAFILKVKYSNDILNELLDPEVEGTTMLQNGEDYSPNDSVSLFNLQ